MSGVIFIGSIKGGTIMHKLYFKIFEHWTERKRFYLLTAFLFMVGISQIFPQNYLNQHVINSEKSNFRKFKNFKANALTNNYDIIYHRANWEAYPDQYYIKGAITSYFKSKMDGMAQVVFDLSSQLQVDSVTQQGVKSTFTFQNQMLTIQLSKTLAFNDIDSVTIFYQGAPVDDGFGSFATSQHGEGTPVLWTLSEPYGARDWWPCKQSLTDKIDSMDIFVKSNKEFKVGSNGKLIKETVAGDLKTTHWQTKYPIATYLVAIAITDYSVYSDTALVGDSHAVEILNYAYPESLNQAIATSDYTVHNIEFFSNLFIPYPFYKEKYGHAQFGWGGGMEHQTMTFLCCFNEGLITHELAHQWFGDYVTCGSWKDIWINEGFATFCEGLTMEHFNPGSEIGWRANERDYITTEPGGSVIVDDTTSVNRIFSGRLSYTKGGMFIVMLRNEIGDEAFFNGCKLLLTESAKKGGFATTKQVEEYFETAADTNLTEFFNNWLYGEGYPVYDIVWDQLDDGRVAIKVNQTTSNPSVDFYSMHLDFSYESDTYNKNLRIHNTENGQIFIIDPGTKINNLSFDPENKLVAKSTITKGSVHIDEVKEGEVVFHPNPVNQKMIVESKPDYPLGKIKVFDNNGKNLFTTDGDQKQTAEIDFSNLKAGSYIIIVEAGGKTINYKFVVNH